MPQSDSGYLSEFSRTRIIVPVVAVIAILVFVFAYLGIQKSRSDSLELLRQQGAALIEALTLSADNAIKANSFFDLLVQEKFSDLAGFLESRGDSFYSSPELADFASAYGIDAVLIFDSSLALTASGAGSVFIDLNRIYGFVLTEIDELLADSTSSSAFRIVEGDLPGEVSIFYLTRAPDGDHIIAIVSDALFYSQAKENIGIGYLVQNIAREVGIEYILFQTMDGIIFSSRKIGPILKIEKDPFLLEALESDSVFSREYVFNDRRILELVKRFSSVEYPEGVFRLGLSLDKYHDIVAGFDWQMIALSLVLFVALVLGTLYLIGKQKRLYLDRSFRQMKSMSEKVFDSVNAGLVALRRDGVIDMANRQFLSIFELRDEDLSGQAWDDCPCREYIPLREIMEGRRESREIEAVFRSPSGEKNLLVVPGRIIDRNGTVTGAVAVVYDYTRVKELEAAAQRRARLSELGDMAAGVAHEIRNPLNAISIAAQRLLAEFEPEERGEEFKSFTRQIKTEANRLNEIVTRFLSMARERGKRAEKLDISRVIEETVRLLGLDLDKKGIVLKAELEPGIRAAVAEDRLKQLVINLLKNAIEACQEKGGRITVRLARSDDGLILEVVDTGPGIPPDIRGKIFSPYYTTKSGGVGLGLSIVHQIVDELGGQTEVISPPEGGSLFRITFPSQ